MFRIVSEKRGDAVTGFRVQRQSLKRAKDGEGHEWGWANKGRRVFTVSDARELLAFYEREQQAASPQVTYEEIPVERMANPYEAVPMSRRY